MYPHTVNRRKRRLWYAVIAVSVIGLAVLLVDIVPPGSRTLGHMMKVRSILKTVYARMGRVPDSLEELVRLAGQVDPSVDPHIFRDEWGVPLLYEQKGGNRLELSSWGKDGRKGGKGAAADIRCPVLLDDDAARAGEATDTPEEP